MLYNTTYYYYIKAQIVFKLPFEDWARGGRPLAADSLAWIAGVIERQTGKVLPVVRKPLE